MNNIKDNTKNMIQSMNPEQKKKGSMILGGILLTGVLLIGGNALLNNVHQPVINIMDDIEISVNEDSWDGKGNIFYNGTPDFDRNNPEISKFVNSIRILTPENNGHLSNGDEVTLKAEYNEQVAKEIGVKVENTEKTITVSGLKEMPQNETEISSEIIALLDSDAKLRIRDNYFYPNNPYENVTYEKVYNAYFIDPEKDEDEFNNQLAVIYKIKFNDTVKYRYYYVDDIEKGQTHYDVDEIHFEERYDTDSSAIFKTPEELKSSYNYIKFFNGRDEGYKGFIFNEK